jgi:hypothetical protein
MEGVSPSCAREETPESLITLLGRVRAYPDMAGVADILSETEAGLFSILRTIGQTDEQERLARSAFRGHATAH